MCVCVPLAAVGDLVENNPRAINIICITSDDTNGDKIGREYEFKKCDLQPLETWLRT